MLTCVQCIHDLFFSAKKCNINESPTVSSVAKKLWRRIWGWRRWMVKSLKFEGEYRHGKQLKKKSIGRGGVKLSFPLRPNFSRGSPLWDHWCPCFRKKFARGPPLGEDVARWWVYVVAPAQECPTLIGVHLTRQAKILPGVPPYGRIHAPASEKMPGVPPYGGCCAVTGCCGCPYAGAPDPDQCRSSLEKWVSRPQPKCFYGPPLGGNVCRGGGLPHAI